MNKSCPYYYLPLLFILFCIACSAPTKETVEAATFEPVKYVDPFIGTGFHGHTFPGPSMPFGMVQLSPDTHMDGWDASSGYHYDDDTIYGFSHTHLSGTGIGDYGDILVLPFTGAIDPSPAASFKKADESASPGYYKVLLDNFDVQAELTSTFRVGVHRYSYQKGDEKKVMVDLGHILQPAWGHKNVSNELEFVDDRTIRGVKMSTGWAYEHHIYFYMEFSTPFTIESTISDEQPVDGKTIMGTDIRTYLNFGNNADQVLVKVSISAVDKEGAEKNLKSELTDWDFEGVRQNAVDTWNDELSKISVETSDESLLTNFYTALYHSMMAPQLYQDVDGRYRGMDLEVHQSNEFENYTVFSLWDTFRALHPLMTIIDERRATDFVNGLLVKYQEGTILPKWPLAANYTGTMVGYPAVSLIADAQAKGLSGIDYDLGLEASLHSANYDQEFVDNSKLAKIDRVMKKHLKFLNAKGFVPADSANESVSYGLEYAYYDWCIAQMAKAKGDQELYEEYMKRAKGYEQYYDTSVGFMRGKVYDGSWHEPFSPYFSEHQKSDFTEGNAWQWTWFVPHDIAGLIELMGGEETFAIRLDSLFSADSRLEGESASGDITGLIGQYAHGNEPSHHIAHMYNYVDKSYRTQELIDQILKEMYKPQPDGLRGNEDCGQMSAWYVMNAMGFYQVCPGDPTYSIGRPLFDSVKLRVPGGGTFTIDVENNSADNKYVASIELDGNKLSEPFFKHTDIKDGGVLKIKMSATKE